MQEHPCFSMSISTARCIVVDYEISIRMYKYRQFAAEVRVVTCSTRRHSMSHHNLRLGRVHKTNLYEQSTTEITKTCLQRKEQRVALESRTKLISSSSTVFGVLGIVYMQAFPFFTTGRFFFERKFLRPKIAIRK